MKLTGVQKTTLDDIAQGKHGGVYNPAYKPVIKLVQLGLVLQGPEGRFGGHPPFTLTESGRRIHAELFPAKA